MESKYSLGNIKVLFKTDFEYEPYEGFEVYRTEFDKPDITYEFILQDGISAPDGWDLVYSDIVWNIFRKDGVTLRYYGYMTNGKRRYSAIISDECAKDGVFKVWLQGIKTVKYNSELRLFDHFAVEHVMALFNGVMLHSSFIIHNGEAILFSAPSGTGKSTQADLWNKNMGSTIANGDRSLLRLIDGKITVYSLPYCGTSGIFMNVGAPLKSIVVLRQAPYNKLTRLRPSEAFKYIYSECAADIWYKDDIRTIGDIIEAVITTVPVYMLECLPDVGAVHTLADALGIEY